MGKAAVEAEITSQANAGEEAFHTFRRILAALQHRAACPCALAMRVGIPEQDVYPFLAELLARDWIRVVSVDALTRTSSEDSRLLDQARVTAQTKLAALSSDHPHLRIVEATRIWFDFFREIAKLQASADPVYVAALTRTGEAALDTELDN